MLKKRYILLILVVVFLGCKNLDSEIREGTLSGEVVLADNESNFIANAKVIITDVGGEQGNMRGWIIEEVETNSEGRFEVELEEGTYLIEAFYEDYSSKDSLYVDIIENKKSEIKIEVSD